MELYHRHISRNGFSVPLPAFIKHFITLRYALDYERKSLVETRTQHGDTPWLFSNRFETIYTIELSSTLTAMVRKKFLRFPHVRLIEGYSV